MPRPKKTVTTTVKRGRKPTPKVKVEPPKVPKSFLAEVPTEKRLYINKKYYICVGDSYNLILREVVNKKGSNGQKLPDNNLAYSSSLQGIFNILTTRYPMIVIGDDATKLFDTLIEVREFIKKRVPSGVSPKDLFTEVEVEV